MRTPLIAGNWKMNKTEAEAISLVRVLMQQVRSISGVEVLICPPFTSLSQLHKLLVSSPIKLGAQNISDQPSGAYTGEISGKMAAEFCTHVILGHSERRAIYEENDNLVNRKVKAALEVGLIPVLCVGENMPERDAGKAASVVSRQLNGGLEGIFVEEPDQLVIAYEPVWAIGTGRSASPGDISDLIGSVIRPALAGLWGDNIARGIRVLYGGSVNPGNAGSYFNQSEIDGALVGGASLSAASFFGIIEEAI
ncbi:MAG: triose-phosphate isomerase [Anaerolineales bacterium]|nr:MAG: triose-phosphate isomerase [Anaerolineales bacterium]